MQGISEREWDEKLRLCPLSNLFPSLSQFIRREETEQKSMATQIQKMVSKNPDGNAVEKQKAFVGNETVKTRALKIIGNVNPPLARFQLRRLGAQTPANTETQLVAAPNKVTCHGINEKSKNSNPHIDEIDLPDVSNSLAVVEYVQDIYAFYKEQEHLHMPIDYMDKQPQINSEMREILVDWIMEVHYTYKLRPETLYLTIYIVDRYLSIDCITRMTFQLVGLCAMFIACKYEETKSPQKDYFLENAFNLSFYSREEILGMEKIILNKLGWYLTIPTNYMFLVRYVKIAKADKELEHMIYFLAELGLMQYDLLKYCPSMVAASAVYTARCTLGKFPLWTDVLEVHTSFSEAQLLECARVLVKAHCNAPGSQSKVVYEKYTLQKFGAVARYPPAISLWVSKSRMMKQL